MLTYGCSGVVQKGRRQSAVDDDTALGKILDRLHDLVGLLHSPPPMVSSRSRSLSLSRSLPLSLFLSLSPLSLPLARALALALSLSSSTQRL